MGSRPRRRDPIQSARRPRLLSVHPRGRTAESRTRRAKRFEARRGDEACLSLILERWRRSFLASERRPVRSWRPAPWRAGRKWLWRIEWRILRTNQCDDRSGAAIPRLFRQKLPLSPVIAVERGAPGVSDANACNASLLIAKRALPRATYRECGRWRKVPGR